MSAIITENTETGSGVLSDFMQRVHKGFGSCMPQQDKSAVVVAVSGGSDSLALLLLTRRYLQTHLPACRLIAVTVDHGLRAESATEAAGVAEFCKKLNIPHQTLRWEGAKPASGLAMAARNARYDLLVQAVRACDAGIILTGHTADDQVETYLMRRERADVVTGLAGEGRGLAAMAGQTLLQDSVLLCRPLLSIWREELRDVLRAENIRWFDDPSNDNPAYERPRIRQAARTLDKQALLAAAEQAAEQRLTNNRKVVQLLSSEDYPVERLAGDGLLLAAGWYENAGNAAPLMLGYLLAAIGGQPYLPPMRDCNTLADWLLSAPASGKHRKTLHSCVVEKSAAGILIRRERRNLPVMLLHSSERAVWDGRYTLSNKGTDDLVVAAVNENQLSCYLRGHQIESTQSERDILLSAPAIFRDGTLIEIPALSHLMPQASLVQMKHHLACFDRVLSGHDFEVAKAVKVLLTMPFNHIYR